MQPENEREKDIGNDHGGDRGQAGQHDHEHGSEHNGMPDQDPTIGHEHSPKRDHEPRQGHEHEHHGELEHGHEHHHEHEHGHEHHHEHGHEHDHVEILVNGKPVALHREDVSGLQIKEAAIKQGVNIKIDFLVFRDLSNGQQARVPDDEVIRVHQKERFDVLSNDDHS